MAWEEGAPPAQGDIQGTLVYLLILPCIIMLNIFSG